ncbi:NAD(P)/FAD-dependent oxidoreductase [Pseudonocardia sp. KRD291]|uniref:flavin-containing monooxygenase n=1 Tax=Pseudonocardia sp. KRD291 TaxID=2792007 RepID=UPI001C49FF96|nr:NAD(P)/FAD-dependent oxidoreductase [Pseudonocardia sp. KRD291]MBW0102060.1 NAD(P)/FAD-dependent oxidoreductase [Pseudonocardia sp. KRD291]
MTHPREVDAVIVGAGFAGMYQLHRLRELGFTTRVFEAGDGVGGTWYWNRYPGARCDVESMSYSYSFSPELEQDWEWTEKYPAQPEILRYAEHVADRFDLGRDITFETRVTSAAYDEGRERWLVTTDTGETVDTQFLIMATGCLSASKLPEVPGLDRFQGQTFHTAHWPRGGVDFTGQRVAVIGTGSSGVQSIPIIASQAAELTVFQRTPAFSLAARNRPLEQSEIDQMKARYRDWRAAQRASGFGVPIEPATKSALEVSEAERTAKYQGAWDGGTLTAIIGGYTDILADREANETAAEFVRQKIRERVTDPQVAETLSPRSYPIGTKRPCLDTNYYETYNQPHVHLVDLRKTPLVGLTETGVATSEDSYDLDAVVFATGFDAMTGALTAIDIRGRGAVALKEKWSEGPRSYLGLCVTGFPNLFTITGPSSPSVLSNMIVSIEQHVEWVSDALAHLRQNGLGTIEATAEAEDGWVAHVEEVGNATLYPQADSWYMGSNVPGKPRVFMAYIGGVGPYRELCTEIAENGYRGFALTPALTPA